MNVNALSKKKRRKAATQSENDSVKPVIINALKGCIIGPITGLVMILVMSAAACRTKDPASLVPYLSYAALLISAFAAGFSAVKINRHDGMLCGAITGTVYRIFIFVCSLFFSSDSSAELGFGISLGLRSVVILASVLGALLGEEKKQKKRKRR